MAKFNPVYPFEHLHGKYVTGGKMSYRETFGVNHTYVMRNPYQGPASEAQTSMRQVMGIATQYAAIILRDPAVKAEWKARCEGTNYRRPDRLCVAEYYKIFKSDPEQLQAALAVIAEDKQRKLQERIVAQRAKDQVQQQLQQQQDQSSTALLQAQIRLMAARIAELEAELKSK